MAARGVRIAEAGASAAKQVPAAMRRRPRQSRAQASSQALQDAFVRVLIERGYARTTIREVVAVAGVGVGTFYEYFGNMHALAALCIHQRVKTLESRGRAVIAQNAGAPRDVRVNALLDQQVGDVLIDAPAWAALFQLERQISSPQAFRQQYLRHVGLWHEALRCPGLAQPPLLAARMVHAMVYGWVSQCLLTLGPGVDAASLRQELGRAVLAYVAQLGLGQGDAGVSHDSGQA